MFVLRKLKIQMKTVFSPVADVLRAGSVSMARESENVFSRHGCVFLIVFRAVLGWNLLAAQHRYFGGKWSMEEARSLSRYFDCAQRESDVHLSRTGWDRSSLV